MKKKVTAEETAQKLADIMSDHFSEMSHEEQKLRIKDGQKVLKATNPKAQPICYSDTHAKPASTGGTSHSSATVRGQ